MLSMLGMTPRPKYISFRCERCREEVGRSRDPKLLARRSARTAKKIETTAETSARSA
jgi:hypothetical protein